MTREEIQNISNKKTITVIITLVAVILSIFVSSFITKTANTETPLYAGTEVTVGGSDWLVVEIDDNGRALLLSLDHKIKDVKYEVAGEYSFIYDAVKGKENDYITKDLDKFDNNVWELTKRRGVDLHSTYEQILGVLDYDIFLDNLEYLKWHEQTTGVWFSGYNVNSRGEQAVRSNVNEKSFNELSYEGEVADIVPVVYLKAEYSYFEYMDEYEQGQSVLKVDFENNLNSTKLNISEISERIIGFRGYNIKRTDWEEPIYIDKNNGVYIDNDITPGKMYTYEISSVVDKGDVKTYKFSNINFEGTDEDYFIPLEVGMVVPFGTMDWIVSDENEDGSYSLVGTKPIYTSNINTYSFNGVNNLNPFNIFRYSSVGQNILGSDVDKVDSFDYGSYEVMEDMVFDQGYKDFVRAGSATISWASMNDYLRYKEYIQLNNLNVVTSQYIIKEGSTNRNHYYLRYDNQEITTGNLNGSNRYHTVPKVKLNSKYIFLTKEGIVTPDYKEISNFEANSVEPTSVELIWDEGIGYETYILKRDDEEIYRGKDNTFTDEGLISNFDYKYTLYVDGIEEDVHELSVKTLKDSVNKRLEVGQNVTFYDKEWTVIDFNDNEGAVLLLNGVPEGEVPRWSSQNGLLSQDSHNPRRIQEYLRELGRKLSDTDLIKEKWVDSREYSF